MAPSPEALERLRRWTIVRWSRGGHETGSIRLECLPDASGWCTDSRYGGGDWAGSRVHPARPDGDPIRRSRQWFQCLQVQSPLPRPYGGATSAGAATASNMRPSTSSPSRGPPRGHSRSATASAERAGSTIHSPTNPEGCAGRPLITSWRATFDCRMPGPLGSSPASAFLTAERSRHPVRRCRWAGRRAGRVAQRRQPQRTRRSSRT